MRYFLHSNGGWMTVPEDTGPFGITVPDGYQEVTEEEYNAAAGTIVVELPQEPPTEGEPADDRRAATSAKNTRASAK
ncbi:hypothetical protein ACFVSQ_10055 [Streptomyces niveus]|uniref:hypothetical protein n=1 Tax=Streptomyces niveus TaxID=193462 RepID=UPI0036EB09CA